jgi:hypothetical protein
MLSAGLTGCTQTAGVHAGHFDVNQCNVRLGGSPPAHGFPRTNTVGAFTHYCHILDHEDAGMMGPFA